MNNEQKGGTHCDILYFIRRIQLWRISSHDASSFSGRHIKIQALQKPTISPFKLSPSAFRVYTRIYTFVNHH